MPSPAATFAVSTRCAPEVSTSSGSPSASKISEWAIWPVPKPSARAADPAGGGAAPGRRGGGRRGVHGLVQDDPPRRRSVGGTGAGRLQGLLHRDHVGMVL